MRAYDRAADAANKRAYDQRKREARAQRHLDRPPRPNICRLTPHSRTVRPSAGIDARAIPQKGGLCADT